MERINEQEQYLDEAAEIIAHRAALPGVHRRPDAEHDDPAVASRLRMGRGACAPVPRRSARTRAQAGIGIAPQETICG